MAASPLLHQGPESTQVTWPQLHEGLTWLHNTRRNRSKQGDDVAALPLLYQGPEGRRHGSPMQCPYGNIFCV